MFFLGYNFLGADEVAIPISPVFPYDDTVVEVSGVMADTLAITKDVSFEPSIDINDTWDFDTILIADYNTDTLAGNVKWTLDTISHVAVKRRIQGEYKWITLAVKAVNSVEDMNIRGTDITAESLVYEYAIVPILDGIEGDYSGTMVDVSNSDLVLIDATGIYHTPITDGYCDTTDVHPNSTLELIYNRYPTIVRSTNANYETINVTGSFLPFDNENECTFNSAFEDSPQADRRRILYSRKVKEFLTNGRAKILKNVDGQTWLVYVTTPPTDAADGYYNVRKLTFGCTEIGSMTSEEDLYRAGLLDIPEEWWYDVVNNNE